MAKTSKYAVNEICINGKTYVHNPLFRVVGSGSGASNPEDATLNMDWYEDTTGNDTGNVNRDGEGFPDVYGLRASVKFDIQYRGRVIDCYVGGESHNLYYRGRVVSYLDIPQNTVLDIVYDGWWNIMSLPDIMCIKYDDLRWLTANGCLIPGMKYRIIDYIPAVRPQQINGTYYHVDASVTQFDIIVTALSENELSEDAEACLPEQCDASRNYYKSFNVNLGSWKLKYTIDDNPLKYDWATGFCVNNPGRTLYTDGKIYSFGAMNGGSRMGYTTSASFIYYQNTIPKYVFDFSYDSCYTVPVGVGTNVTSGSKDYTLYGDTFTVSKNYQYIIDGELYYASGDIYIEGKTSQSNILLISESQYNLTTDTFGIYIEVPTIWELDEILAISWVSTNRGVVYNMIDDKGNEAPWDFKNICIGDVNNTANIGHFFEKQSANGFFRDESIEGDAIFNNVIKPTFINSYGFCPWRKQPSNLVCHKFRVITQNTEIDNSSPRSIYDNIIEGGYNVIIYSNGVVQTSKGNHIRNSRQVTVYGNNNRISDLQYGTSSICGNENIVNSYSSTNIGSNTSLSNFNTVGRGGYTINIGANCHYNSIGHGCRNITLGTTCNNNSIGNGCDGIILGASCKNNSYGNGCSYCYIRMNTDASATIRNCVENCHWDDGVKYVTLYNTTTNSSSYKVRNVHVHRGMSFATHKFAGVPINAAYEHTVTLALPSTSNSTIVS